MYRDLLWLLTYDLVVESMQFLLGDLPLVRLAVLASVLVVAGDKVLAGSGHREEAPHPRPDRRPAATATAAAAAGTARRRHNHLGQQKSKSFFNAKISLLRAHVYSCDVRGWCLVYLSAAAASGKRIRRRICQNDVGLHT